jgi:hypothetical protein
MCFVLGNSPCGLTLLSMLLDWPNNTIGGNMEETSRISNLRNILKTGTPLGPIDQEQITDDFAKELLDIKVTPFVDTLKESYTLLLGRKGAGKSAMLSEIRLKQRSAIHTSDPEKLPSKGDPYIITVTTWEHFDHIVRCVAARNQYTPTIPDLIPTEVFEKLWYETLWDELIKYFYNFIGIKDVGTQLDSVKNYINADTFFCGPPKKEAEKLFEAACKSIIEFITQRNSKIYFLFDSMENYPVRNPVFASILSGLFKSLQKIDNESYLIKISFCIPEEIEEFLNQGSSNLIKDFASSYRIRWAPIDLLQIVAHRFRYAAQLYDQDFFVEIEKYDFNNRNNIHKLFSSMLPKTVVNALGHPEDPVAYIIRHSQLLPRHIIAIFNSILSRNYSKYGTFKIKTDEFIREGITNIQGFIANQILIPYRKIYPNLIEWCYANLPELKPICSFSELIKLEKRCRVGTVEDDIGSIWHTLFRMGVIGIADTENSTNTAHSKRYCYGYFHYNIDGAFALQSKGEYCFHPVFSRAFGIRREKKNPDTRVVYPANINLETIYE